jgi:hypothetical protein
MPGGASPSSGQRGRAAWAGGAVIVGGLLQFLQQGVQAVHLSTGVLWLATALIVVAGLGVGQWRQHEAGQEVARDRQAALDAALACWPPRSVRLLRPYDVGVHPSLDVPLEQSGYVERDADRALDEAIDQGTIVIVFGPPGAGKSRSTFEAVKRREPDAVVLMVEDAAGLRVLVSHAPVDVLGGEARAVVWLEGLEHHLEGLDLDALQRFIGWAASPRVVLVATIRDDALEQLLHSSSREGLVMRRLLAYGRGVFIAGELSDEEAATFERERGRTPASRRVAGAFPQNWRAGWTHCSPLLQPPPLPRRRHLDRPGATLAALAAGLIVALLLVSHKYGWTVAPPLDEQVRTIAASLRPCQRLDEFPHNGKGLQSASDHTSRVLVAIVSGADCLESDEVRFYRLASDKRLHQIASLRPADPAPRFSFSCIGDDTQDPCHVTLRGASSSIVGAFRNTDDQQELPVVASFATQSLQLRALSLPEHGVRSVNRRPQTLRLRSTSGSGGAAAAGPCRENRGCVSGATAASVAILPSSSRNPALLLTGYALGDTPEAPDAVRVRLWQLHFDGDEPQRGSDCVVLVKGRRVSVRVRTASLADARSAILNRWRPPASEVMC